MKDSTDDFSKVKAGIRNNVHRALSCLGSICRFQYKDNTESTNTENDDIEFPTTINVEGLDWNNLALSSFALFEEYLGKEDILTKQKPCVPWLVSLLHIQEFYLLWNKMGFWM